MATAPFPYPSCTIPGLPRPGGLRAPPTHPPPPGSAGTLGCTRAGKGSPRERARPNPARCAVGWGSHHGTSGDRPGSLPERSGPPCPTTATGPSPPPSCTIPGLPRPAGCVPPTNPQPPGIARDGRRRRLARRSTHFLDVPLPTIGLQALNRPHPGKIPAWPHPGAHSTPTNPHLHLPHLTTETLTPRLRKDISQPPPGLVERFRATRPPAPLPLWGGVGPDDVPGRQGRPPRRRPLAMSAALVHSQGRSRHHWLTVQGPGSSYRPGTGHPLVFPRQGQASNWSPRRGLCDAPGG